MKTIYPPENIIQCTNKLKGVAMQKLILRSIPNQREDISIQKILETVEKGRNKYFIVEIPFKCNDKFFGYQKEFIKDSELGENCVLSGREVIMDTKWKVCNYCQQYIPSVRQKTRKCRTCGKGFFRFKTQKLESWRAIYAGGKEQSTNFLLENKYLSEVKHLKKRIDFFIYYQGVFFILESKNKEITGLNFNDFSRALVYPICMRECGYVVNELRIVFNGSFSGELRSLVQVGFADKWGFKVIFERIEDFLLRNNIRCEEVSVLWNGLSYDYELKEGNPALLRVVIYGVKPIKHKKITSEEEK